LAREKEVVARTEAELAPVTILVNNAGAAWQGTLDTYGEQVARMRQVNVDGVIHATRAVMGSIRARRYGRIVNLAPIAAIDTGLSDNAFYAATKAEVVILTRRFALELSQHGISVNAVGRLRPHRHDAARPRRSGLAGDGRTLRRTSYDAPHR
jgi:3-oxoacyl-[acyl-carrier protein] reductase